MPQQPVETDRMVESVEMARRPALSGWPMILCWLAMIIFACHASTHMVGAGDTWVAMACGRHFLNHGVDTNEPFSANSHREGPTEQDVENWPGWAQWITEKVGLGTVKRWHPTGWVNQNWLTHVIFYWLTHKSPVADAHDFEAETHSHDYNTLVYWKFAIYIITVICVYYIGRLLGVNPALSAAFACFAMFVGRSFFDIRPAGFSNLLVAVFLLVLVLATYRNILYMWLMVPIVVFWCNVHGGYIYAFIALAAFFTLHLLIMLPKRWTASVHSILMWAVLYVLAYKFLNHRPFSPISPLEDRFFLLLLFLIAASLFLAWYKRVGRELLYGYHVVASLIIFLWLLQRFYPGSLERYPRNADLLKYVSGSRQTFLVAFFGGMALGIVVTFLKDRLVSIGPKGIMHTFAASFVAFVAMIIFNPFHLTNLTHTFEISVSEHAERWRTVNEWHPGFEWSNPVGTSFPFLVLFMLCIGLTAFWLFSRFLLPSLLRAPKNELYRQRNLFSTLSKVLGFVFAVFVGWVVFISFSFVNLDARDFLICGAFMAIVLLSVYKSVHFIYLTVPLILLALYLGDADAGYTGRYIYPFVLLPVYVVTHILVSLLSRTVKIEPKNIIFPAGTAVVTLFVMVAIFNPFKFGSLFTVDLTAQNDLDRRIIPGQLRRQFQRNERPLSPEATVSVEQFGGRWVITDESKKYVVKKERRRLNIYKSGSPLWEMRKVFGIRRPWRPQYERAGEKYLNYGFLYTGLYIVNIILAFIWVLILYLRKPLSALANRTAEAGPKGHTYEVPKIDLALLVIAALTVYMAYRSRRFIPIAAIAACPLLAMLIDEMTRAIAAARSFHERNRLTVPPMSPGLKLFFILIAVASVVGFGTWWTLKFKYIYIDPWPTDPELTSVFMRMTNSDAKPFYACKFIKDNKLKGKMFNYWTEGGFIAYGQEPDRETGKTPLQLFMDGRAQAAYMRSVFDLWTRIMAGGPVSGELAQAAKLRGLSLGGAEYTRIGRWIDKELKDRAVWVVLMPAGEWNSPFVKGLEHHSDWVLVFYNNKQKLFVDITRPQAQLLFQDIRTGKTVYPEEFSRNLILAHHLLSRDKTLAEHKEGLDYALKAFELRPSQVPMLKILSAAGLPDVSTDVTRFAEDYFNRFTENKEIWARQKSYYNRIVAAFNAANYLRQIAVRRKETKRVEFYSAKLREYSDEQKELVFSKRW